MAKAPDWRSSGGYFAVDTGRRSTYFTARAESALARLPRVEQRRILAAIARMAADDSLHGSKPLAGRREHSLRIGPWRVLFAVRDSDSIQIIKIGPRGDVYRH